MIMGKGQHTTFYWTTSIPKTGQKSCGRKQLILSIPRFLEVIISVNLGILIIGAKLSLIINQVIILNEVGALIFCGQNDGTCQPGLSKVRWHELRCLRRQPFTVGKPITWIESKIGMFHKPFKKVSKHGIVLTTPSHPYLRTFIAI